MRVLILDSLPQLVYCRNFSNIATILANVESSGENGLFSKTFLREDQYRYRTFRRFHYG